jgi:hypothetical protein
MTTAQSISGVDETLTPAPLPADTAAELHGTGRPRWTPYPDSAYEPVTVRCEWPGCDATYIADRPMTTPGQARRVAVRDEGWTLNAAGQFLCPDAGLHPEQSAPRFPVAGDIPPEPGHPPDLPPAIVPSGIQ